MKKTLIALFLFVTLFIFQNGFSQSNKFNFTIFGGYSMPVGDLKGELFSSGYNSNNYLMKNGFNIGGAAKYNLDRTGCLQLTGSIIYNAFSNTKDTTEQGFTTTETRKIDIFSLNIGAQYNFMPNQKVNPYLNLDLTNNFFGGSIETSGGSFSTSSKLKSTWRGGLQFGAGVDLAFSDKVGIVLGVNYNMANLIGKATDSMGVDPLVYSLNDKEYTFGGTTYPSRSISYLQIYTGVSIYLDRRIKR